MARDIFLRVHEDQRRIHGVICALQGSPEVSCDLHNLAKDRVRRQTGHAGHELAAPQLAGQRLAGEV